MQGLPAQLNPVERDVCSAGYHNDALYAVLEPAIRPLVALLADEEDKTRSNAAGALGNLVRNSNLLCGAMLRAGALEVTPLAAASCQPYAGHQLVAGSTQQHEQLRTLLCDVRFFVVGDELAALH